VVFFVDDNFIGNKIKLKGEILPAIIVWMETKRRPFSFITEASIDLSDDEELMHLMVKAGFDSVFLGVETPNEESLAECSKFQNKNRDLVACVNKFQKSGLNVMGGFIVWFLGIKDKARIQNREFFFWSIFKRPQLFLLAITYAIYGFHFRKIFKSYL
jgi:radical SAM superfamily enzyme YgiQ (UPF0313 family)